MALPDYSTGDPPLHVGKHSQSSRQDQAVNTGFNGRELHWGKLTIVPVVLLNGVNSDTAG